MPRKRRSMQQAHEVGSGVTPSARERHVALTPADRTNVRELGPHRPCLNISRGFTVVGDSIVAKGVLAMAESSDFEKARAGAEARERIVKRPRSASSTMVGGALRRYLTAEEYRRRRRTAQE